MSLTSALNTAQSIFNNTGTQSATVSGNIANAGNKDYVRRQAMITTSLNGASVVKIDRAQEDALLKQYLASNSQDSAQQTLLNGLEDVKSVLGGNDYETSPSEYLSAFQKKLAAFQTSPNNVVAAQGAINAAQDLANSLNNATASVQNTRAAADKSIATQVDTLNSLLSQFETANNAVKNAVNTNSDPSDALDQRDKLLKQISSIVSVKPVSRNGSDMALYTSDGVVLFDTIPREVKFTATPTYQASDKGNGVYIDGVALAMGQGGTTSGQGSLQALLQIRDDVAPKFQSQLDEIAKGLVNMFAETKTDGSSTTPGLFVWTQSPSGAAGGMPTVDPVTGQYAIINGMAGSIKVNSAVITSQGGDPMKLRDGSINDPDPMPAIPPYVPYSTNLSGNGGYTDQLDKYYNAMGAKIDFDPGTGVSGFNTGSGLDSNVSIMDFAANSIGWLEQYRSSASDASENTSAALARSDQAYSNETGVNLDEELTLMLDIEQSYKAATKILNAVDEMLKSLLDIAS
ncbi:flagellar hook-associated protein FlgK [Rhizobium sp. BE258]|jgi:flagellar hook-associated protein 1 FlgK|uniref:flagellar hook-associated protein FlgK n=1 Tax=Rhizobium sp. BE258 TaxID=2817722 RepID=UPI000DD7DAF9|nr:flagellar hook-associated protein FlgK [Rhizobium sp. BE258]MDR7143341.1 flagellar hook-associated protein 1 FlgK [Rhizobium sp. BE258]